MIVKVLETLEVGLATFWILSGLWAFGEKQADRYVLKFKYLINAHNFKTWSPAWGLFGMSKKLWDVESKWKKR